MIPYGRQSIADTDIAAVIDVLRSDFLTQGPWVPQFEAALCNITGARHAVAVNSATSALHIACLALGLQKGDMVWTSPITFVASANCALYCGATVDFVDIDPATWTMSPIALAAKIDAYLRDGRPLPKIIIPVHLSGQSADMAAIRAITAPFGIRIIEDASHAIGACHGGVSVGSCQFSDIVVFSFHPVKIVTTGEGGAALTNDPETARRMELLRSHGITRNPADMTGDSDGPWYYEQIALGFNYRMTDMAAALGCTQLSHLSDFIKRRNDISAHYEVALSQNAIRLQHLPTGDFSARHLFVVRVPADRHAEIFSRLRARDIGVNLHYIPVYRQPYFKSLGLGACDCPEAERYYAEAISLPIFPDLSHDAQSHVITALHEALS
jgi:UDP-4-amino-4,6-dideoxy-N-acetyl-beta-L-altrosamine transaminase